MALALAAVSVSPSPTFAYRIGVADATEAAYGVLDEGGEPLDLLRGAAESAALPQDVADASYAVGYSTELLRLQDCYDAGRRDAKNPTAWVERGPLGAPEGDGACEHFWAAGVASVGGLSDRE